VGRKDVYERKENMELLRKMVSEDKKSNRKRE